MTRLLPRTPAAGFSLSRGAPAEATPPARVSHAAELVWRRAAQPEGRGSQHHPLADAPEVARRSMARQRVTPEVPAAPAARPAREAPSRPIELDPVVLDRLADDVIRRVDRRARIDRERRGL